MGALLLMALAFAATALLWRRLGRRNAASDADDRARAAAKGMQTVMTNVLPGTGGQAAPDFGPLPVDRWEDDSPHTLRVEAPPRPEEPDA